MRESGGIPGRVGKFLTLISVRIIVRSGRGNMPTLELLQCECNQCGHKWYPRCTEPRVCPACHSLRWDKPKVADRTSDQGPEAGEQGGGLVGEALE